MEIIKILGGNQRNLNVVNIHLLLLDQIQQQVEGPVVHRDVDLVAAAFRGGPLCALLRVRFLGLFHAFSCQLASRRRHSFSLVAAGLSRPLLSSFFLLSFSPPLWSFLS